MYVVTLYRDYITWPHGAAVGEASGEKVNNCVFMSYVILCVCNNSTRCSSMVSSHSWCSGSLDRSFMVDPRVHELCDSLCV